VLFDKLGRFWGTSLVARGTAKHLSERRKHAHLPKSLESKRGDNTTTRMLVSSRNATTVETHHNGYAPHVIKLSPQFSAQFSNQHNHSAAPAIASLSLVAVSIPLPCRLFPSQPSSPCPSLTYNGNSLDSVVCGPGPTEGCDFTLGEINDGHKKAEKGQNIEKAQ